MSGSMSRDFNVVYRSGGRGHRKDFYLKRLRDGDGQPYGDYLISASEHSGVLPYCAVEQYELNTLTPDGVAVLQALSDSSLHFLRWDEDSEGDAVPVLVHAYTGTRRSVKSFAVEESLTDAADVMADAAEAAARFGALFASPVVSESERARAVVEGLDGVLVDILDDSTCDVFSRALGDLREAFEADAHDAHNCILDVAAEWRNIHPRWPWRPTRFFVGDPDAALVDGEFDYAVYADAVEKQLIDMTPTLEEMIDKYNGEVVPKTWKYGSCAAHTYTPASPADFSLAERAAMFQKFVDEQLDRVYWSAYREESGQYESSQLLNKMYHEFKAAYRLEK